MKHFRSIADVPSLHELLDIAFELKKKPFKYRKLGKRKTVCLIFFNPSLRTRLSSQRAATNLGMETIVFNVDKESWKIELEDKVVMNGAAAEHIKEAAAVIGQYAEIIGVRSFATLQDRQADYAEKVLESFVKYAGRPIISLESATRHPLQSLADLITIEEFKTKARPKVVLSWAPHPHALPQAVPNSFVEWMKVAPVELVVTHPEGYELAPEFIENVKVEYDQNKAFEGADFIYAKNWSSYSEYGKVLSQDSSWMITAEKMRLTNNAKFMHCLPVRRNQIVTDEVLDSPSSIVIPQAANRVAAAQAVYYQILRSM
ncbi:MAG: N-acetylornithine carbamoyltransferase [Cytophagales bacterium]|nr:N-acetylornithine carbamoyltransferase [Cytophagales bacterium]MDW8384747.1 N-acetylornithine carbamoyltransferase [Flammeovirgaceae bacterium]